MYTGGSRQPGLWSFTLSDDTMSDTSVSLLEQPREFFIFYCFTRTS